MTGYDLIGVPSDAGELVAHVQPGAGPLVILQHGLCGDANQPAEIFPAGHGYRHGVLECRGHGKSPVGAVNRLSIARFTADLEALIRQTGMPLAVGGISMGAAMALRLAVTRPGLVGALILVRPAWATEPAPANMQPNAEVGRLLAQGATLAAFEATPTARMLATSAPDNLASLRAFFSREPPPLPRC